MTKLTMPEPVQRDDTEHGINYYTAEALRDVLEQAAKAVEAGVLGHGECAAMIRAMMWEIK